MDKMNIIGERIERLRTEKKETQTELAAAIGVKRETVHQWEAGTRDLKTGGITKLAQHFNVSTDWLLGLSDVKSYNSEAQGVHNYTGLSEDAISFLKNMKHNEELMAIINLLFDPKYDYFILEVIKRYLLFKIPRDMVDIPIWGDSSFGGGYAVSSEAIEDLGLFHIQRAFKELKEKEGEKIRGIASERISKEIEKALENTPEADRGKTMRQLREEEDAQS